MSKNTTDIKLLEVLAFTLHELQDRREPEETASLWRNDTETRSACRQSAAEILEHLAKMGAKISVRSSDLLDKSIQQLETQPATKIYSLGEELLLSQTYGNILESDT